MPELNQFDTWLNHPVVPKGNSAYESPDYKVEGLPQGMRAEETLYLGRIAHAVREPNMWSATIVLGNLKGNGFDQDREEARQVALDKILKQAGDLISALSATGLLPSNVKIT